MKKTKDERLENGSVVYWSQRFKDGRTPSGSIRWRVPVRCGECGQVRDVGVSQTYESDFSGLCYACANVKTGQAARRVEDEKLANGSMILWSQRRRDGRKPNGGIRWRVPVRCGRCGKVREVGTGKVHRPDFTGLCSTCASLDRRIDIPGATLERLYHDGGLSMAKVGDRLGCSVKPVWKRMREHGIESRPVGGIPQTLVPEEVLHRWSPELAYVVGMVATDGNLKRGSNGVKFFSTDYQWIKTYQTLLRIDTSVYERPLESGKTLYTVELNDPDYRAFLEGVGLTPAKSTERTLGPLNVPDVLFRDFLRACIDGDGGIYAYPRKRCSTLQLKVELTSSCRPFLAWIQEAGERLVRLEASGLRWTGSAWSLTYYDHKARRLLEWLYYAPDLPCLERKRAVWEEYLRAREET